MSCLVRSAFSRALAPASRASPRILLRTPPRSHRLGAREHTNDSRRPAAGYLRDQQQGRIGSKRHSAGQQRNHVPHHRNNNHHKNSNNFTRGKQFQQNSPSSYNSNGSFIYPPSSHAHNKPSTPSLVSEEEAQKREQNAQREILKMQLQRVKKISINSATEAAKEYDVLLCAAADQQPQFMGVIFEAWVNNHACKGKLTIQDLERVLQLKFEHGQLNVEKVIQAMPKWTELHPQLEMNQGFHRLLEQAALQNEDTSQVVSLCMWLADQPDLCESKHFNALLEGFATKGNMNLAMVVFRALTESSSLEADGESYTWLAISALKEKEWTSTKKDQVLYETCSCFLCFLLYFSLL